MSRRGWWRSAFLGATAVAVGMELWASADGDEQTDSWTALVIEYVPWEFTAAAVGALVLWLPAHWGIRYWRKHRQAPTSQ